MQDNLEALRYVKGNLQLLDQRLLPHQFKYIDASTVSHCWTAIREMQVRGAPAIALAAVLSLATELWNRKSEFHSLHKTLEFIESNLRYLETSRPTAVNLFDATAKMRVQIQLEIEEFKSNSKSEENSIQKIISKFIDSAEAMLKKDVSDNKSIGKFGAEFILNNSKQHKFKILTHCNTGSLATAAYGTAMGIIRSLHEMNKLDHAFCTETRPYNQGARLTAFELVYEKIPGTLITDSMAAFLMQTKGIDAVVVGADRVVANGDTANKIGTYALAIAANYHKIPFIVAAPTTTIDLTKETGNEIHIEERPPDELTYLNGTRIAAEGIGVWNPSFDVTPAHLISAIITEKKIITKNALAKVFNLKLEC